MWVVFYFFLFTNGSAFSEPMENSKSSKFAVSALLGIAAPLGTLGGSWNLGWLCHLHARCRLAI